jgi:hypothetical protein
MAGIVEGVKGALGISNFPLAGVFDTIIQFVTYLFFGLIALGIVFLLLRYRRKKKSGNLKKISWWEEIGGRMTLVRDDDAEELTIPGTNLKLLYVKRTNSWLPRFTRGITKDHYFVAITSNKEIVNFELTAINHDMKTAGLLYDHTDMRWAAENIREFVKRNFKDKSVPWWREYKDIISVALMIFVMTFSFVIIIWFMRGMVADLGNVSQSIAGAAEKLNACTPPGSGVILSP